MLSDEMRTPQLGAVKYPRASFIGLLAGILVAVVFLSQTIPIPRYAVYGALGIVGGLIILTSIPTHRFTKQSLYWTFFLLVAVGSSFITKEYPFLLLGVGVSAIFVSSEFGWWRAFLKAIVFFALVHALATIFFYVDPTSWVNISEPLGLQGALPGGYRSALTPHYTVNAIFIASGLVVAGALTFASERRRPRHIVVIGALLLGLILTTKRAHLAFALAAVVLAVIAVSFNRERRRRGVLVAIAVLISLFAVALPLLGNIPFIADVLDRFTAAANDDSFNGRSSFYAVAEMMWQGSPWLGKGWGSFTETFNETASGAYYISRGFESINAHNVYLQLLAEVGLLGLAVFLIATLTTLTSTLRMILRGTSGGSVPTDLPALVASFGLQIFFLLYCLTGNPLYDLSCVAVYLFGCAISWSMALLARRHEKARTQVTTDS